jgi:hypothetical protein
MPSEADEQMAVFQWAELMQSRYPEICLLHSSMNGILTDARFGAMLKRLGRRAGIPDIFLPVARPADPFADGRTWLGGLWVEMKRKRGGVVSPEQKWWHEQLTKQGYRVAVARGKNEAIRIITEYLEG